MPRYFTPSGTSAGLTAGGRSAGGRGGGAAGGRGARRPAGVEGRLPLPVGAGDGALRRVLVVDGLVEEVEGLMLLRLGAERRVVDQRLKDLMQTHRLLLSKSRGLPG